MAAGRAQPGLRDPAHHATLIRIAKATNHARNRDGRRPSIASQPRMNQGVVYGMDALMPTRIQTAPTAYDACTTAFHRGRRSEKTNASGSSARPTAGMKKRESILIGSPN